MDINCEGCKYWEKKESEIPFMGLCHRYAPRPMTTHPLEGPQSMDAIWPRTKNDEWCGEWKAKVDIPSEA